ncbi:MAG: tetratricopeptide repeat protein [Planctomycetota bacterium]|nr:tetratricopeptide repeat protein [Planctomycetota bacterium]
MLKIKTPFIAGAILAAGLCTPAIACIWDTNTLKDELQTKNTPMFHLITGQFAHHGPAFYERQAAKARQALKSNPKDIKALNNLGAAYTKLGRYKAAQATFLSIEKIQPGKYETLSNLGVLHKKMKDFDVAGDYLEKALKIKPEGHMGLGDWYLKMIRYQAEVKKSGSAPSKNFLGHSYDKSFYSWRVKDKEAFLKNIKALIRNDRSFADSYVVLGDYLMRIPVGTRNLALWSYVRALQLGHKNPAQIQKRITAIYAHWKEALEDDYNGKNLESHRDTIVGIRADLEKRGKWLEQFMSVEAELVKKSDDVDFDAVHKEMAKRKIAIAGPANHGMLAKSGNESGKKQAGAKPTGVRKNGRWGKDSRKQSPRDAARSPREAQHYTPGRRSRKRAPRNDDDE